MDAQTITPKSLLNDNKDDLNHALTGGWMQVGVTLRKWDDRVRDEVLADELKHAHNVDGQRVGDFYKRLLGDSAHELTRMNSAMNAVRTILYRVTKKLDRDFYVAPIADMPDVIADLNAARDKANEAIEDFLDSYNQRVGEAQAQLKTMAHSIEYPSVDDVRARIGVDVRFTPIPDMRTFEGMALPAEVAATFAAQVGNQQRDLVTSMVDELYSDLVDTTATLAKYFANKSAGEKGSKLYDSRISQIKRLARQLSSAQGIVSTDFGALNEAVNKLAAVDFDAAKASIGVADDTAKLAQEINDTLTNLKPANTSAPVQPTIEEPTFDETESALAESDLGEEMAVYERTPKRMSTAEGIAKTVAEMSDQEAEELDDALSQPTEVAPTDPWGALDNLFY